MPEIICLNGSDWRLSHDNKSWIKSCVPGSIVADLADNSLIDDPFYSLNNEKLKWIDNKNWYYKKEFFIGLPSNQPLKNFANKQFRYFLNFKGVDYHCKIFLNNHLVTEHVGMFSPILKEVTNFIKNGKNTIFVKIYKANSFKIRENTLKCQMSYGWDFAPKIITSGIWDDVEIWTSSFLIIKDLHIKTKNDFQSIVSKKAVEILITAEVDSLVSGKFNIKIEVDNETFKNYVERIKKGTNLLTAKVKIESPKIWNCWEDGEQHLYEIRFSITDSKNRLEGETQQACLQKKSIDSIEKKWGIRDFSLTYLKNLPKIEKNKWCFLINGTKKFIRGANWVPCDSLIGKINENKYRKLIKMAKEANINLLRVWGGGLCEKEEFYELCDQEGILIWQEFPFACPSRPYSKKKKFLSLVKQEASAIVKKLRNHPSVVLYCGGNEYGYKWNKKLVDTLDMICLRIDGTRPFVKTSPTKGDAHNWVVWHSYGHFEEYLKDKSNFLSEFGLQACPDLNSLKRFLPENCFKSNTKSINLIKKKKSISFTLTLLELLLYTPNTILKIVDLNNKFLKKRISEPELIWRYHNAQLGKLLRYADIFEWKKYCKNEFKLDFFVTATQFAQAFALKTCIENFRLNKNKVGGVIFWQLNDPWPNISWSVIDYYLKPKTAYNHIKEIYNPVGIFLKFKPFNFKPAKNVKFQSSILIVNDLNNEIKNATVKIIAKNCICNNNENCDNKILFENRIKTNILANCVYKVGEFEFIVPEIFKEVNFNMCKHAHKISLRGVNIDCYLFDAEDKIISTNHYSLNFFDETKTPTVLKIIHESALSLMWLG